MQSVLPDDVCRRPCAVGVRGVLSIPGVLLAYALLPLTVAVAQPFVVIDEILASWQGVNEIQFIELRFTAPGQGEIMGAEIEIQDSSGDAVRRLRFPRAVLNDVQDASVLIATPELGALAGIAPDFEMPADIDIPRQGGRICYRARIGAFGETTRTDCVAYGTFGGDNERFGRPTPITPDSRSLQRSRVVDPPNNEDDWEGELSPTPRNNFNDMRVLETTCLNEEIEAWEDCEGDDLGGMTCADLGFSSGTLNCTQCKLDISECTNCGNAMVDAGEECDGTDLNEETCTHLGFTRGMLACSAECVLDAGDCQELQIPGKGPRRKTCFLEWNIINPGSPVRKRRPPINQKCVDNDPTCDFDGGMPNSCAFRVHLCFNRDDGRTRGCRPRGISAFELRRPSASSEDPIDQENARALTGAALALGGSASDESPRVTFSPPLEVLDICTEATEVVVPVKERPGKRPRKGKRIIKATATDALGRRRDRDKIKLVCRPGL